MAGGGPASGKSVLFREGHVTLPRNIVNIDSDAIKSSLPEYNRLIAAGDSGAGSFSHRESSVLSKRILAEASAKEYNVFLDGAGDSSFERLSKKIKKMKRGGQRTIADYVTVDTETAVTRNVERAKKTGRMVPNAYLRQTHKNISEIFPKIIEKDLFDEVTLWDTNTPGKTIKVMEQVDGKTTIFDRGLWDRFLAKAK